MKRLFDIVFSLLGLVITSPIFLILSIVISIDSPGGVFFRGPRVGKNGKVFYICKFRSMLPDCEGKGKWSVTDHDDRITKVGHFLRKSKLDELPQFINVLKGEMSFVGPRPELQYWVDLYTDEEKIILNMKPGITDWASMANFKQYEILGKSSDPDKAYYEVVRPLKLKLQLYHARHNTTGSYFKIIFWTVYKVITRSTKLPAEIQEIVDEYSVEYSEKIKELESSVK